MYYHWPLKDTVPHGSNLFKCIFSCSNFDFFKDYLKLPFCVIPKHIFKEDIRLNKSVLKGHCHEICYSGFFITEFLLILKIMPGKSVNYFLILLELFVFVKYFPVWSPVYLFATGELRLPRWELHNLKLTVMALCNICTISYCFLDKKITSHMWQSFPLLFWTEK